MPFLLIITLVVVPNFLTSLIIAVFMIVNFCFFNTRFKPIYIFFGIVVPFAILIFNKWSGEKSKRLDYAKTIFYE